MSHIGGQERQLRLDIDARSIPAKYGVDGKAVAKIMNPRRPSIRGLNLRRLQEMGEPPTERLRRVGAPTLITIPDQRGVWCDGQASTATCFQIAINFAADIIGQREKPRFVKLGSADEQGRLTPIVIGHLEP